jgi:hypothetical protein
MNAVRLPMVGVFLLLACAGAKGVSSPDAAGPEETGGEGGRDAASAGGGGNGGRGGAGHDAGTLTADGTAVVHDGAPSLVADAAADTAGPVDLAPPSPDGPVNAPCHADPNIYRATAVDPRTCLVWQNEKQPARTNVQAAAYCDRLVLDGFSDWRLPAPEELATWPALMADSNAYVTGPTYIPVASVPMDGCTQNAHSCNLAEYNPGSLSCAWQGVGFMGASVCVRGTAMTGTVLKQYAATSCDACRAHVAGGGADFKTADCLPFAK